MLAEAAAAGQDRGPVARCAFLAGWSPGRGCRSNHLPRPVRGLDLDVDADDRYAIVVQAIMSGNMANSSIVASPVAMVRAAIEAIIIIREQDG